MRIFGSRIYLLPVLLLIALSGCASPKTKPEPPAPPQEPVVELAPVQIPETPKPEAPAKPVEVPRAKTDYSVLKPVDWKQIDGFYQDDLVQAWQAWLIGCETLKKRTEWQSVCEVAASIKKPTNAVVRAYFEQHFSPFQATNVDGTDT